MTVDSVRSAFDGSRAAGAPATNRTIDRRPVAIIGAGMIGDLHRRAATLAGADVIGVLASTPRRSTEVAHEWGVEQGYATVDDVVASRAEVVHVCTPNASHAPLTETLISAGKHVVCEKPLGLSASEAQRMTDLAAAVGVVATVPFVYRYHPLIHELRARREAGEFGAWHLLHGSYLQDWMLDPGAASWRVDPTAGGPSRAFADIGSHWCDLVEWVSGERITEVNASTTILYPERPGGSGRSFGGASSAAAKTFPVTTEDAAVVIFRTAHGVLGNLTVSQVSAGRKNRLWFQLDGSSGSAVFDQENPETVWLGSRSQSTVLVRDVGHGSAEQLARSPLPAGHTRGYAQCFEDFVADTYLAVDGHNPENLPRFVDGLRTACTVDAVLRSARSGTWTALGVPAQDIASQPVAPHGRITPHNTVRTS